MNHTDKSLIEFANTINSLDEFGRGKDKAKRRRRAAINRAGGMNAPSLPDKPQASLRQKVTTRVSNASKKAGDWLGNPISKAKAGFQSNDIGGNIASSALKGKKPNITSTSSLGNTARKLGAAAKNVANTRAGKIGAAVAGAGLLGAAGLAAVKKMRSKKDA